MGSYSSIRRLALAIVLLATVGAAAGAAHAATLQRVGIVPSPNYDATRSRAIRQIVIHVTEGSFWGSIGTLRNPSTEGSAHFVISREGEIVQLVSTSDIAWHAGNARVNAHSIGIEHEGHSFERGSITEAEYEASARLVAYLATRFGIPLDRRHIIGHDEVPDPYQRGLYGGFAHHVDPGPYWNWPHYMALIRAAAQDPEPPSFERVHEPSPPVPSYRRVVCYTRGIRSSTIGNGQTVSSLVAWDARACGRRLHRVDFSVDGRVLWRDWVRPFSFRGGAGWNTLGLANGWHSLTVHAYGPHGYTVRRRLRVRVENHPFTVGVRGVSAGESVTGNVVLGVRASSAAREAELLVDGETAAVETAAPFRFAWNPIGSVPGPHTLEVRALAWDGRTAVTTVPIEVENVLDPDISDPAIARWLGRFPD